MDLPGSDWGDFSCRRAVDSSSFSTLGRNTGTYLWYAVNAAADLTTKGARAAITMVMTYPA